MVCFLFACARETEEDLNAYDPQSFPARVSDRVFEMPLDPSSLIVVIPSGLESKQAVFENLLTQKTGLRLVFRSAVGLKSSDLQGKHLILLGNIMNNPLLLDLYMKRRAFADAFFPGEGGVFIHPAKSVWDPSRNVLVVSYSREEDAGQSFAAFLDEIRAGSPSLGAIRVLRTGHRLPEPPESAEPVFGAVSKDLRERPAYRTLAEWGWMYFFTGDPKWADLFRQAISVLHERAEKAGRWITEPWSNVYFALWNIFESWRLIDDDPIFSLEDRRMVEDVLWGYTRYIQARPYLDQDKLPLYEPRQNHSTFLALSLDSAYRYYREKFGLAGLDSMADKVRRCFDLGQAASYRPNDDGGSGYQVLAPKHYLYYALQNNDLSFLQSGKLRTLVDLMTATIDSRGDPVTFGDIGVYSHRRPGRPQMAELQFLSLAAWFYKDGAYRWLYDWLGKGSEIDFTPWSSFGLGLYATEIEPAPPSRWIGIFPVLLDDASLRWSARRSQKFSELPIAGKTYFDKLAFRGGFDPRDEYLLLDGTSTFAHGHEDGNTVTRLTWLDRIWLFDLHYIKAGPQEHNGVSIVRNGTQDPPPPLNELECAGQFEDAGFTLTTARDWNGADWQRHIFWKKGRYFLFLDRITAREPGGYRLENRWRTRGEVKLEGNTTTVRQGAATFFIKSADSAGRQLVVVPDEHNGDWDYPYGSDETVVCLARKKIALGPGSSWVFANLLYATEDTPRQAKELTGENEGLYLVDEGGSREIFGLGSAGLARFGLSSDGAFFALSGDRFLLFGFSRLSWPGGSIMAKRGKRKMSLETSLDRPYGVLLLDEDAELSAAGVRIRGFEAASDAGERTMRLQAGKHELRLDLGPASDRMRSGLRLISGSPVFPEQENVIPNDFGLEIEGRVETGATTAACPDGERIVCGSAGGSVFALEGEKKTPLFDLPGGKAVLAVRVSDLDRDGRKEIVCSDVDENLFCYDEAGGLLWRFKTQKYFGRNANVVDIWIDDIDGNGALSILAATNGWKLYALRPEGTVRWETFIFYHQLTKVRVLKNKGRPLIAVGTVYQTPFNLVDPKTGTVLWKTWEQTGSETMSTTDYCGKHLRDMVFTDTDGDGEKEIIFGNEYHSVYALNAADGKIKWKAQLGDKVSAVRLLRSEVAGEERILAATEAGEIYLLDRHQGRRLRMISLESGITGMEIIPGGSEGGEEIVLATAEGRIAVLDSRLQLRASLQIGLGPILGIYPSGNSGQGKKFYVVGSESVLEVLYVPLHLRPSRHY